MRLAHPRRVPTEYGDIVVLESLVHVSPSLASSNHGSARCCIVGYLGELSGVDLDSVG